MKIEIQTTELIRTSQTWDGVQLPNFSKGKPEKIKAILHEAGYIYSEEQDQFRPIGYDGR